jgi:ADP-ribose pyrophosphatase YjhB (NUDIX family)
MQTHSHTDIISLLDDLQCVARNGLHYTSDPYDRERYSRLLDLASHAYAELLQVPGEAIRARLLAEIGPISAKVGADAAIFSEAGEILLLDRADGSRWCLPCGLVEPNERPAEAAIRELREETGLEADVRQLVGVFTRFPSAEVGPRTTVGIVFLCEVVGGVLSPSREARALKYWRIDDVPIWHPHHDTYARASLAMWKSDGMMPAIAD